MKLNSLRLSPSPNTPLLPWSLSHWDMSGSVEQELVSYSNFRSVLIVSKSYSFLSLGRWHVPRKTLALLRQKYEPDDSRQLRKSNHRVIIFWERTKKGSGSGFCLHHGTVCVTWIQYFSTGFSNVQFSNLGEVEVVKGNKSTRFKEVHFRVISSYWCGTTVTVISTIVL